ncbi:MAG TPA: M28 family peptidase [Myxococcota bacterium]|nr:M28 family peptidase [Myxococcota bacterium]
MTAAGDGGARRVASLRELVEALCAPACAGRAAGTREGAAARAVVMQALASAGAAPAGEDGYLQPVPACGGANVVARVRSVVGADAAPAAGASAGAPATARAPAGRYVLVGAHYDHLGRAGDGQAYWGADDNAAAVAALVDVAAALAGPRAKELRRDVLLCAFDAEEPPHFLTGAMGSQHFARRPLVPLDRIDTMVCLDLVGHAFGRAGLPEPVRRSLFVLGAEKGRGNGPLVDGVAAGRAGVRARRVGIHVIPPLSDYHPFAEARVPYLFLTCGRWEHYHQTTDTPERLDYAKLAATADFLADLVVALSARPEAPVEFLPEGQDDLATVTSLLDVSRALLPFSAAAAQAVPFLEALAARAGAEGTLDAETRDTLALLVASLEAALAA